MIERTEHDGVATLRLIHGKVNAMDTELLLGLAAAFEHEASTSSRAVILTGNDRCLSAGVDLVRLLDGGAAYIDGFFPALEVCFERLAFFPKPLVVAANGHAIAGGCVLLCGGDWRLVAAGKARIGLTELPVGVPFPGLAIEIVRAAVSPSHVRKLIYRGATYSVDEAGAMGLYDEVVAPEDLLARAHAVADELGRIPAETFRISKRQLTASIRERAAGHPSVIERWKSDEVLTAIRGFVDRTFGG